MNHTNTTTTADALALHIADFAVFTPPVEIELARLSANGASIAEAMATIGILDLTAVDWAAAIDDFRGDGAEVERL